MTYSETHMVTLTKLAKRSLQEKVINSNLSNLLASVNTRALMVRGWNVEAYTRKVTTYEDRWGDGTRYPMERNQFWQQDKARDYGDAEWVFRMFLVVNYVNDNGGHPEPNELNGILRTIATRVQQPSFGKWVLSEVDGGLLV